MIDVLAAAQIDEGHEIATKVIKFESDLDLAERYLVSVSLSTQPSERLLTGENEIHIFLPTFF